MVYLMSDAMAAGIAQGDRMLREIRAPYNTVEEALEQAEHDLTQGRLPLRIEDADTQEVLWKPQP